MKKCFFLLLAVLLTLSLAACGEGDTVTTTTADLTTTAATTTTASVTATELDGTTTTTAATTSKPIDKKTVTKATTTVATTTVATTTVATTTTTPVTEAPTTTTTAATTTTLPKPILYDSSLFIPFGDPEYNFQADGSLNVDMLAVEGVYGCDISKYLVSQGEFQTQYAVPEADVLVEMRKTFVVPDDLFAKVKAKKSYAVFGPGSLRYENSQFLLTEIDGWGGGFLYSDAAVAYADDGKGTLTVYHDHGRKDLGEDDYVHQYYYSVTYTYSGTAALTVYGPTDDYFDGFIRSENKNVLDSLRVKAIQKVDSVNGYTAVKTEK